MKKKFVLKFKDFEESQYYKDFKSVERSVMSFDEFSKSLLNKQQQTFIFMTFDLSGTKRYDLIKKFLKQNKFQTQLPDGSPLTRNTYLLLLTGNQSNVVSTLMTSIVAFIQSQYHGKRFRVFVCETNDCLLYP